MMATKVRRLPLVVSGVQGGIWFTDCVADWVRNRRAVSTASCPGVPLSMKICARRKVGRRKWARRRFASYFSPSHGPLRYVTYHSLVTHVSCSPLCENEAPKEETAVSTWRERQKHSWRWGPFHCRLADCLDAWQLFDVLSSDCLSDWLIDVPVDLVTDELIDWLTDWLTD